MRCYIAGCLMLLSFLGACTGSVPDEVDQTVTVFFSDHPEFGQAEAIEELSDWADGPRRRVFTIDGSAVSYEVYLRGAEVVTVWAERDNGERALEWGSTGTLSRVDDTRVSVGADAEGSLPAYTILGRTELLVGGRHGDVLIPSMSRTDPDRERVFRAISTREDLTQATFYSTEDAYRANGSAAFLAENPEALQVGFLGSLTEGEFLSGESLFP